MSEEVVPTEEQKLEKIPNCSQHETEQIRFWCETCDEKLCNTCFENDHEGHNIQSMKNFLKKQIETYNTEISDLSSGLDKMIVKCQVSFFAFCTFKKNQCFLQNIDVSSMMLHLHHWLKLIHACMQA